MDFSKTQTSLRKVFTWTNLFYIVGGWIKVEALTAIFHNGSGPDPIFSSTKNIYLLNQNALDEYHKVLAANIAFVLLAWVIMLIPTFFPKVFGDSMESDMDQEDSQLNLSHPDSN